MPRKVKLVAGPSVKYGASCSCKKSQKTNCAKSTSSLLSLLFLSSLPTSLVWITRRQASEWFFPFFLPHLLPFHVSLVTSRKFHRHGKGQNQNEKADAGHPRPPSPAPPLSSFSPGALVPMHFCLSFSIFVCVCSILCCLVAPRACSWLAPRVCSHNVDYF